MTLITKGGIAFTPATLRTNLTLDELASAMLEKRASRGLLDDGWGSVDDDPNVKNRNGFVEMTPHPPHIVESSFAWEPRRLMARYYWRWVDKELLVELGDSQRERVMRVGAADIVISETSTANEYLLLIGARLQNELSRLIAEVQALGLLTQTRCQVLASTSPLSFGDDDFFRWLTFRWVNNPVITEDLHLRAVRGVDAQDRSDRGTSLKRGIDMDRPEYLALIMTPSVRLGPAKFVVSSEAQQLSLDIEVRVDGGFSIQVSDSTYDDRLDRPEKGLALFRDTAYYVLPEMQRAFNDDAEWREFHRERSIEEARELMRAALKVAMGKVEPCVHCGKDPVH